MPSNMQVFCPKIICVVSRTPFYRAMRRFDIVDIYFISLINLKKKNYFRYLRQLYSLSLSNLVVPIEYFVASVVDQVRIVSFFHPTINYLAHCNMILYCNQVPLPIEGGRSFHVQLDCALISAQSRAMASIKFDIPHPRFFPHMDLDFSGPLRYSSDLTYFI